MKNIENIADELFNKIRSRFEKISLGDETGKNTDDPEQARFFNFEYVSSDGTNHGEITASLVDNQSLKLVYNKDMNLDELQQQEWQQFLRGLRMFAKRNLISFDVRDITRTNLTKRDIKQTAKSTSAYKATDSPVTESVQWHGTTRTSIQDFGATRLIVRHSEAVNEEQPGSRSRKIESMFVETDQGERFRMPYNRLSLGRAMAQHLAHGGKIYDEAGQYISGMAEEMSSLGFFIRNTRNRQFEDTETQGMVETAVDRYKVLSSLGRLGRTRSYQNFAETFVPESDDIETYDIDALKERFVKKMFDDRLTAALPYVYKAYHQRQVGEDRFVEEFDRWTEQVVENELDEPDFETLKNLMASPLEAGPGGVNAIGAVNSVVDNDELNDLIIQTAELQGEETDVRKVVDDWFIENYPEYTSLIPVQSNVENVSKTETPKEDITQAFENLRRLAGLK
jgi:hypothetical protein